ncbi:DUF106 domain-containing protein [archaeon]|nr:DUF106 domain-containing protein [archaeon]
MFLDPALSFLLAYHPVIAVTVFSVIVLIIINVFYRILMNQADAKQLKEKTKELNKQMRVLQKEGKREESNKLLSEVMRENSRLMRMTMKPMLVSFIIVIILLPWLSEAYGDRIVTFENDAGKFSFRSVEYQVLKSGQLITVNGQETCSAPCAQKFGDSFLEITKESDNIKFAPVVAMLPVQLPVIGNNLGWLGWYILVSVPVVVFTRKLMRIYA